MCMGNSETNRMQASKICVIDGLELEGLSIRNKMYDIYTAPRSEDETAIMFRADYAGGTHQSSGPGEDSNGLIIDGAEIR